MSDLREVQLSEVKTDAEEADVTEVRPSISYVDVTGDIDE